MRKTRIIATDIDMTLTDSKLKLDTAAVEKIRRLEAKGIRVILTTGRNLAVTGSLAQFIGTCGLVVAENGGAIGRYQTPIRILGKIDNARAALDLLKRKMKSRIVERPDSRYGIRLSDVSLERTFRLEEAKEIIAASGLKVRLVDSGVAFLILDAHLDKGRALRKLAKLNGFSMTNVAAIGDNYNDLDLFREVGYKIAVGNAPEEVKSHTDYACKNKYGKGFLEAVAHLRL